jgi:Flp pilus assembly protein TadG
MNACAVPQNRRQRYRKTQCGAAAIEFALIFIVFFTLFYAIVSYAIVMMLQSAFLHAAEEGARAAIAVDRLASSDYEATVESHAEEQAMDALDWMSASLKNKVTVEAAMSGNTLSVKVAYSNYTSDPLVPILTLPAIGQVPKLPDDLAGTARINLY